MDSTINWYQSRTIRAQLVAWISLLLSITWIIQLDDSFKTQIVDTIVSVVTVISQFMSIYYRIKASNKISK